MSQLNSLLESANTYKSLQSDAARLANKWSKTGLLEGMATGLPTACSDMSSMSEILGEAGIYFNPLDIDSIADRLKKLIKSDKLRKRNGLKSMSIARKYSWDLCANETLQFLKQIKKENS